VKGGERMGRRMNDEHTVIYVRRQTDDLHVVEIAEITFKHIKQTATQYTRRQIELMTLQNKRR